MGICFGILMLWHNFRLGANVVIESIDVLMHSLIEADKMICYAFVKCL